ncbi:MAG: histidine kinase [Eubacteriales bacterium]|nr:histidine kinase [Eubacteriales bacterium]
MVTPLLIPIVVIVGQFLIGVHLNREIPKAVDGTIDLSRWKQTSVIEFAGEWEFYWNRLLSGEQIRTVGEEFSIVEAPSVWTNYSSLGKLPAYGCATYRVHMTGVQAGVKYGVRIQNMATVYRLYVNDELIAQNGDWGDDETAPVSRYRPQFVSFIASANNLDMVLQISNNAYASGGMWEPIFFGVYNQVKMFDSLLSDIDNAAIAIIFITCVLFLVIFVAQHQDKEIIALVGIGTTVLLRMAICPYSELSFAYLLPNLPIAWIGRIDYLTLIAGQFLFAYFAYCEYGRKTHRGPIAVIGAISLLFALAAALLPYQSLSIVDYTLNSITLPLVLLYLIVRLAILVWRGQPDASVLLGTLVFLLMTVFYYMLYADYSIIYYVLSFSAFCYIILLFAECIVVSRRYYCAQKLEISYLKGQIQPHFLHNSLACIIGISRTDPNRTRELLQDLNTYLGGFFDYDSSDLITLRQELELVQAYINLERIRGGAEIEIEYQIDSDSILLPPLILQPLVENALVHGLRDKEGPGRIVIYAKRVRSNARIGVSDNGAGFHPNPSRGSRAGVGLENINGRLSKLFHTELVIAVPPGGGCDAYMEIPWKEADE